MTPGRELKRGERRERHIHIPHAVLTVDRKSDLLLHRLIDDVEIVNATRNQGSIVLRRSDKG